MDITFKEWKLLFRYERFEKVFDTWDVDISMSQFWRDHAATLDRKIRAGFYDWSHDDRALARVAYRLAKHLAEDYYSMESRLDREMKAAEIRICGQKMYRCWHPVHGGYISPGFAIECSWL